MVQVMSSPQADRRPTPRRRPTDDRTTFLSRWLKVWVILLTVVTLVVVGYLVVITDSLASINGNLATAQRSVVGARGNVVTLPNQVDRINGALAGIDATTKALLPVVGNINGDGTFSATTGGVAAINLRAQAALPVVGGIQTDFSRANILGTLGSVDRHAVAICNGQALALVGGGTAAPRR